ncbi:MAG: four helix bundle protein [Bergeyella sp.]
MKKENIVLNKSLDFALCIIEFCELLEEKKKYVVANQLLRSGTSIGANIHEAQNPNSNNDFINKIKIAAKEAEETKYWLYLCEHAKSYPFEEDLKIKNNEILLLLYKILSTSIKNKNNNQ